MWGSRVIVPPCCREAVLRELHEGHLGMTKTKSLARCMYGGRKSVQLCQHCQYSNQILPVKNEK